MAQIEPLEPPDSCEPPLRSSSKSSLFFIGRDSGGNWVAFSAMRYMSTRPAILSLTPRHRSWLIASIMLALIAIVFAVNGRAPGGVNLRPRDLLQTISLATNVHYNGPNTDYDNAMAIHERPSTMTDTDPNDPTKTVPTPDNASNSGDSNPGVFSAYWANRMSMC